MADVTDDRESFDDQVSRLELMADPAGDWDLSDNDRRAIGALLTRVRDLDARQQVIDRPNRNAAGQMYAFAPPGETGRELSTDEASAALSLALSARAKSLDRQSLDRRLLDALLLDCLEISDRHAISLSGTPEWWLCCRHCDCESQKDQPIEHAPGCVVGQIGAILKGTTSAAIVETTEADRLRARIEQVIDDYGGNHPDSELGRVLRAAMNSSRGGRHGV